MKTLKLITGLIIGTIVILITPPDAVMAQDISGRSGLVSVDYTIPKGEIVWLTPGPDIDEIESKKLQIKFGIKTDRKIEDVAIRHNGLKVSENYGFKRGKSDDPSFSEIVEHVIPLEGGKNEILVAFKLDNGQVIQSGRTFILIDEGLTAIKNRKNYALLIATNEYENFENLNNPVHDVRDIARELRASYGFEIDPVENPTKEEFGRKIVEYTKMEYGPYDQLFIFVAGHGQYDETLNDGFLVFQDTKSDDPARDSFYSHTLLSSRIDNIGAPHIFIVLDACFSGTFDPGLSRNITESMYTDVGRLELLQRKLELRTRQFMTSGGKEYVKDGRPGMNSPFAARFLEALRSDGGRDGILTYSEFKDYVDLATPQPRYGTFGTHQPGMSEFVFERK